MEGGLILHKNNMKIEIKLKNIVFLIDKEYLTFDIYTVWRPIFRESTKQPEGVILSLYLTVVFIVLGQLGFLLLNAWFEQIYAVQILKNVFKMGNPKLEKTKTP